MKVRGTMKLSTSYRRNALLKELIQANVPLSLTQLAQKLGVKERMIRYDIADVAQSLASYQVVLQQKPKLGYYILPEHKALLPLELSGAEDPNHFERKSLECEILFYLMSDEYVSAQRIAEVLFLSPVTVTRIIEGMHHREEIPLTIEAVRFKGYHVHEGRALLKLLKYRLSDRFLTKRFNPPKAILETMSQAEIDQIDTVLKQCNRELDVWMTPKGYTEIKASWILALAYASRLENCEEVQDFDHSELEGELNMFVWLPKSLVKHPQSSGKIGYWLRCWMRVWLCPRMNFQDKNWSRSSITCSIVWTSISSTIKKNCSKISCLISIRCSDVSDFISMSLRIH